MKAKASNISLGDARLHSHATSYRSDFGEMLLTTVQQDVVGCFVATALNPSRSLRTLRPALFHDDSGLSDWRGGTAELTPAKVL